MIEYICVSVDFCFVWILKNETNSIFKAQFHRCGSIKIEGHWRFSGLENKFKIKGYCQGGKTVFSPVMQQCGDIEGT